MAIVNVSNSATVTIDGRVISTSGTFAADISDLWEQTLEVGTTYIVCGGQNQNAVFYLFINNGSEDAVVRFTLGADYARFPLKAGAHMLISSSIRITDGTLWPLVDPAIRALSGSTRVQMMVGTHA